MHVVIFGKSIPIKWGAKAEIFINKVLTYLQFSGVFSKNFISSGATHCFSQGGSSWGLSAPITLAGLNFELSKDRDSTAPLGSLSQYFTDFLPVKSSFSVLFDYLLPFCSALLRRLWLLFPVIPCWVVESGHYVPALAGGSWTSTAVMPLLVHLLLSPH